MPHHPRVTESYRDFQKKIQLFQTTVPRGSLDKLTYTNAIFVFWKTQGIALPFSKARSCVGKAPTPTWHPSGDGLKMAQGELGKSPSIPPESFTSLAIINQARAIFSASIQDPAAQFYQTKRKPCEVMLVFFQVMITEVMFFVTKISLQCKQLKTF